MAATKLSLYQGALRLLGERLLASLAENREPRRILDSVWDGGAMSYCLESGQWKFAARTIQLDFSPSVEPDFGFTYAFDKPTDHVRTMGIWSDDYMRCPLEAYREESGFWVADLETLYIKYVSDDAAFGADMSKWPQTFVKFFEAHLASEAAMPLTGNRTKMDDMLAIRKAKLSDALSKDAMADPTKELPSGSWVRARSAGWSNYRRR